MSGRSLASMTLTPGKDGQDKFPVNMATGGNGLAQLAGSTALKKELAFSNTNNGFKENTNFSATTFNATREATAVAQSTVAQSTSFSSESLESSESLGIALTQIPWMRFKVIAEPDMSLFAKDPRLQSFIRSITQTTVSTVSQEIVNEFRAKLEQLTQSMDAMVSARMASVTDTVIERITSLTNVQGAVTQFQNLDINQQLVLAGANGGSGGAAIMNHTEEANGASIGAPIMNHADTPSISINNNPSITSNPTFNNDPTINNNPTNNAYGGEGGRGGDVNVNIKMPPIVIQNGDTNHKRDCPNKDNDQGGCDCPTSCPRLNRNQRPIKADPPTLATANWIWTKEVFAGPVPGCARPFRRDLNLACPVNCATIDITCDNFYSLYVNGKLVGTGMNYQIAQRFSVTFDDTNRVVIAVYAVQDPISLAQVGLACSGVVWNSQAKAPVSTPFQTDTNWRTISQNGVDSNFIKPDFNDDNWEYAVPEGPFPTTPPWAGHVITPTSDDRDKPVAWPGVPGVPPAPNARPATFFGDK